MNYASLFPFFLHAAPTTPLHWWADWGTPVVSVGIAFLLTSAAIVAYMIEKRRLGQINKL